MIDKLIPCILFVCFDGVFLVIAVVTAIDEKLEPSCFNSVQLFYVTNLS